MLYCFAVIKKKKSSAFYPQRMSLLFLFFFVFLSLSLSLSKKDTWIKQNL